MGKTIMAKLNIAVLGCGRISNKHFQAILDNSDDYRLIAVCDINAEHSISAGEKYGVPSYHTLDSMLAEQMAIEVVALCTPSGLHAEQAIQILSAGRHVITEKPMACSLSKAKLMYKAAQEASKELFVVKQNRLTPAVSALKQAIDLGMFGQIYMVQANVFWTRPQEYFDQASWRGTKALDGGAILNQASHYVDLLEWLVGPVRSVYAVTKRLARQIETEDTAVMSLEWDNDAVGTMSVTMLTYPNNLEGSVTLLGQKGTVRLDGPGLADIKTWQFADSHLLDIANINFQKNDRYSNSHGPYYKNVADVLLRGELSISNAASGLETMYLLDAIYQSAQQQNRVEITRHELSSTAQEDILP
jgi:UDP-N-acetyl-2-amino-2-deoxyglucuronate dehydrogenase